MRGSCRDESELESKVWDSLGSSSKDYSLHVAGLERGLGKQGLVQELALYTLFLDIRVIVVNTDMIFAHSSDKELSDACVVAGFEGECEKRRVYRDAYFPPPQIS